MEEGSLERWELKADHSCSMPQENQPRQVEKPNEEHQMESIRVARCLRQSPEKFRFLSTTDHCRDVKMGADIAGCVL